MNRMNIMNSVLVEEFLRRKTTSKATIRIYRYALRKYFKANDIENIDDYFNMGRNYTDDVWKFATSIFDENFAPITQRVMLTAVKGFLDRNDVI